jgi:type IV pilus assembly protein PilN
MRIVVNLASRPFADIGPALKRARIAMGVLALLAICLGLGLRSLHEEAVAARARDHSLDGQIGQITREQQGYKNLMQQPDNAQTVTQAENLNRLFDEKAFSWTLAMEDLETVLPGGVQVSSIDPNREKDGHITLKLRVIGPRDRAVELVQNLEHSRRFLLPRIAGENSESANGPGQREEPVSASSRVNFELLAEYNPATADERKPANRKGATKRGNGDLGARKPNPASPDAGRAPYAGVPRRRSPLQPRVGGPK